MVKRVGIMLELNWPYRRHLDIFAGTQRFAQSQSNWRCEIDEFHAIQGIGREPLAGYDGIIARAGRELAVWARTAKVPLVNVWFSSPLRDQLPGVFSDFSKVGEFAANHLLDRGHRRFGCLSAPREPAHKLMVEAFHRAIGLRGCRCHCGTVSRLYYRSGKSWSTFQRSLDRWIESWKPPIALFVAFNDVTIRYVVNTCRRRGLRTPEDVALIDSTNEPNIGVMPPPSLSSVEVNYELIGFRAAQMLSELMLGRTHENQRSLLPPTGVIARDSTDFFVVNDEAVSRALRFIEANFAMQITVDDVADVAGVSRRTLERRFESVDGRSVGKEIRRLRLTKAKRLLVETNLLVKQIAFETGFRDPVRMCDVFHREEGVSPSEFRRRFQGE